MINNKKFNVIKGLIIGATILSIGASTHVKSAHAFEEESSKATISASVCRKGKSGKLLKKSVNDLVKEGVLTKEKADNVLSYVKKNKDKDKDKDNKEGHHKLFESMVNEKIITQVEADAIREKKYENIMILKKEKITKSLKGLVKDNKITQEQADKFMEKFEKKSNERRELHKKLRGMTKEKKKEYLDQNKLKGKSVIEEMVEEKIITENQAEAIKEAMPKAKHHKEKGKCKKEHKE